MNKVTFLILCLTTLTALGILKSTATYAASLDLNLFYGAEVNPTGNPIGGGIGYNRILTGGTVEVTNKTELLAALNAAQPGDIVYVKPLAIIDLSGYRNIAINTGVTLAGNRGYEGSPGPLLFSNEMDTWPLFNIIGDGGRITGLRLQGPDGTVNTGPYAQPNSKAINIEAAKVEVDNNEIYCWSHAGVQTHGIDAYIHHNYMHHVQRTGLGYPVHVNKNNALIEANLFDWYRHAIAGSGYISAAYEARYNVMLSHAIGHVFDMHGGGDYCPGRASKYGVICTEEEERLAGEYVIIHHNTFLPTTNNQRSIMVRGIPREKIEIYNNIFPVENPVQQVEFLYFGGGNTSVYNNVYGPNRKLVATYSVPAPIYRCDRICPAPTTNIVLQPSPKAPLSFVTPVSNTIINGMFPVEVETNVPDVFTMVQANITLDGQVIYQGSNPPEPGMLTVDTRQLADGLHALELNLVNKEGIQLHTGAYFNVDYWSVVSYKFVNLPQQSTSVKGALPIDVDIDTAGIFDLATVVIFLDDHVIYQEATPPAPGQLIINTRQLADGPHILTLSIINSDKLQLSTNAAFSTVNWWNIDDVFQPPVYTAWFGTTDFSLTSSTSDGWGYAVGDEETFSSDTERRIRLTDKEEYLVWDVAGIVTFKIEAFLKEADQAHRIELAVSADGVTWQSITADIQSIGSSSVNGWQKVQLCGALPNGDSIRYFRLSLPIALAADSIQLGSAAFTGYQQ